MTLHAHTSIVMILYRCLPVLTERLKMDRRRLEQAHFHFAIIQVSTWYTDLTLDGVVFNEEAVALKGKSSENIINTYILLIHTKTHFKNKIALKYALHKEKFSMYICDYSSSAILSTLLPVRGVVNQCRHTTCKGEQ